MEVLLYTDGSATVATKPGGYGWVIVVDGKKHSEGSGHIPSATNNDAELMGAIQGLEAVKDLIIVGSLGEPEDLPKHNDITLISDSEIVLGWASGRYRFKQESKLEKFKQLQLLMKLLDVKTRWVEGHSGDEYNERCDELANLGRMGGVDNIKKKPRKYRWNEENSPITFWDHESNMEIPEKGMSDKQIVCNPNSLKFESILRAACKVLAELVELEEGRTKR